MKDLVLLKLGGSLITDKTQAFTPRSDVIERLAGEIHEAREKKGFKLVVGNGGGSFPHGPAQEFETHKGFHSKKSVRGFALVQDAAALLNRVVVASLLKAGENAVGVQPSAGAIARRSRITAWDLRALHEMLKHGIVPCVYGDVAIDTTQGCSILPTEEVLGFIARKLGAKRLVVASDVDGVFTADPHTHSDARLIKRIGFKNFAAVKKGLGGARGVDVTGGMLGKIERLVELTRIGVESVVVNGLVEGRVRDALLGKDVVGTKITR